MGLLGPTMVGRGIGGMTLTKLDFKSGSQSQSVSLGLPAADRLIIIAASYAEVTSGSSAISNVTCGGVTLSRIQSGSVNNTQMALCYGIVPTGATGVCTISAGSGSTFAMQVFQLTGYTSATPTSTAALTAGSTSNFNAILNLPRASIAIYALVTGAATVPTFPNADIDDTQPVVQLTRTTVAHKLNGPNVITGDSENFSFGTGRASYAAAVWS